MYIRDRQDALDVVGDILTLPSRTEQLVNITVKIVMCLAPDPRQFLTNCQAALISGGLEGMKRHRQSLFESMDEDLILIVDPAEDALFEEVASTRDSLRIAEVVKEVFPEISENYPRWSIARAVLQREKSIQDCILEALKARKEQSSGSERVDTLRRATELVRDSLPAWFSRAGFIRQACSDVVTGAHLQSEQPPEIHAEFLFACVALHDHRAEPFLDWIENAPEQVVEFVGKLHELSQALRQVEVGEESGIAAEKKRTA